MITLMYFKHSVFQKKHPEEHMIKPSYLLNFEIDAFKMYIMFILNYECYYKKVCIRNSTTRNTRLQKLKVKRHSDQFLKINKPGYCILLSKTCS